MFSSSLTHLLIQILGRSNAWRLGRGLYMGARGEWSNDIDSNGEEALISQMAAASGREGRSAVVVDCGANVGDWTAAALRRFADAGVPAQLHLFEPSPSSAERLAQRFGEVSAVSLHQLALSDQNGTAEFFLVSPTGGRNSLVPIDATYEEAISVRTAKGAEFFGQVGVPEIDLFKIDTEGNDFVVIEGVEPMLAEHRIKVIQFEYNSRWLPTGKTMHHVFQLARKHGYDVGRTDPKCIEVYAEWNAEIDRFFEWNYVLLAPGMAETLGARRMQWDASNTLVPLQ